MALFDNRVQVLLLGPYHQYTTFAWHEVIQSKKVRRQQKGFTAVIIYSSIILYHPTPPWHRIDEAWCSQSTIFRLTLYFPVVVELPCKESTKF